MRSTRATGFLLAAALAVAMAGPAEAQTRLGGYNLEGGIEAGVRYFLTDDPSKTRRAKLEEYRDINEGLYLQDLQLRLFKPDESYSTELLGSKWGLKDQEFSLRAGDVGLWQFRFDWDQTPHIFSTTARTPAHEIATGVWTLPGLGSMRDFNTSRELGEVGVRWDTARVNFKLTLTPELDLTVQYTRIRKEGERPFGMAFGSPGNNFLELLEPIQQTVHDLRVGFALAREKWQLQGSYNLSVFENDVSRVKFDNPCFQGPIGGGAAFGCAAGESRTAVNNVVPAQGQSSLPPNNMAHTINIAGGVNLPLRTRITGNLGWSMWLQNEDFLPHTINPTIAGDPDLRLPQHSLNGRVQTLLANIGVTSRPFSAPITLTGKYRLYLLDDESDTLDFAAHVVNDRPVVVGGVVSPTRGNQRAYRSSFTRHNAEGDVRYQLFQPVSLTIGTGWEHWTRGPARAETRNMDEVFGKAALDATILDWLSAKVTYKPSIRRVDRYDQAVDPGVFFLLRRFDEASRDEQRVDVLLQITPTDRISITPTMGWRYDDYLESQYGVRNATAWSAGIDVTWAPTDRLSFSAGYVHEVGEEKLRARNANPGTIDNDWVSNMNDTTDTAHVGAKAVIIRNLVDLVFNGNYTNSLGRVENRTDSAHPVNFVPPWPAFEDQLIRLDTAVRYHINKAWTASLGYAFEAFDKKDWRTDQLTPYISTLAGTTGSVWLGNDARDYVAHIASLTFAYRFR